MHELKPDISSSLSRLRPMKIIRLLRLVSPHGLRPDDTRSRTSEYESLKGAPGLEY